jgi:hypothetical protein
MEVIYLEHFHIRSLFFISRALLLIGDFTIIFVIKRK